MSRYWVFTENQLEEVLVRSNLMPDQKTGIWAFLHSDPCVSSGMCREISPPKADDIQLSEQEGDSHAGA